MLSAAATVVTLVPEDEDEDADEDEDNDADEAKDAAGTAMRSALATRYATVKPFLALLGESKALSAATGGARVLAGYAAFPRRPGGR
ncbi:hypothetical protein SAZ11_62245 [Streptomyces sp. FXJ1.4098]|nr:hypothetical protein [Streptomyces sp. FXJ1.4098]